MEIRISAKEVNAMKEGYMPVVDAVSVALGLGKPERRNEEWQDIIAVGSSITKDGNGDITIAIQEDCVCDFTQQASGFLMKIAAKFSSLMIFCKGLFSEIAESFSNFEKKWGVNESLLTEEQKMLLNKEMDTWLKNEIGLRQEANIPLSGIEAAAERQRDYLLHVLLGRVRDSEGNVVQFEPRESIFCHSRIR